MGHLAKVRTEFIDVPAVLVDGAGGQVVIQHILGPATDALIESPAIKSSGKSHLEQVAALKPTQHPIERNTRGWQENLAQAECQ